MAISKMSNGFYTFSDSYFKSMRKQDLINYLRTIETNWKNSLITNDIQYANCIRLLAEERNKAIDEFAEKIQWEYLNSCGLKQREIDFLVAVSSMVAEQMKAGGIE